MTTKLTIKDIMSKPVSIAKSALITEALDRMLGEGIDPIIVTHQGRVIGTASRRTIAEKIGSKKTGAIPPTQIHVANVVKEDFTFAYPDQEIDILIPLLQNYKIVVVLDAEHKLIGMVTMGDLLKVMKPDCPLEDVIELAPRITPEDRVVHLHRRMVDDSATRFIVNDNGRVLGIVTETDLARALVKLKEMVEVKHHDTRIRNLIAQDIMSTPVISVPMGTPVEAIIDLMTEKNISTVLVTGEEKPIGLVTRRSIISAL
ncbi:MAG: Putative signal-transduction protein with CBS domain [Methanomicrobiales archaeon 53_19]|jgi:predicted transcriptional regulator|uniref:CBS domain-containing protein n=1 Tax=Methanocalculus sp. TaxID=2004547 RepID=UPI000747ED25|nr:CBS domain-containing protein [Methanocalculus sp.]KUK69612.1 MAG: Putative signal-transduction protein with CBS domain [Methanocalculus sp. 52_23]KUL02932.1 MAG: Putative signal-transduction protein with CBS domain [Methanomicrobiales archaeon 53_19]HIJ07171.1 CBS domain-containing protein [Methanocalculus sp.]